MAAGDVFAAGPTSVAVNAFLDIRPGAGQEAVIHNIHYGGAVELYKRESAAGNQQRFDTDSAEGAVLSANLFATNAFYYRVKNVSTGAIFISFDGFQTK